MDLIEAIANIKFSIDASVKSKIDSEWEHAIRIAGLEIKKEHDGLTIEREYYKNFNSSMALKVIYKWWDTSKTFSPGPDRTKITLEVHHNGKLVDSYTNGYDS